jgi:hypothetical protein
LTRALVLVAGGIALLSVGARRLWMEVQVTRKYPVAMDRVFHVTVKDVDGSKQVAVTVEPRDGKMMSPFLAARLSIANAQTTVATVPVEERRDGGKVTYWFRLAPAFVSHTRFELDESAFAEVEVPADGKRAAPLSPWPSKEVEGSAGKRRYQQWMGGTKFWFWVRDFASARP